MKYLFFDIECSDGYHICSFGYVLVDDKMRILEKDDIVINPESKFILSPKSSRPKIELAYSDEYFYKQGNFTTQYEDIKKLLYKHKQIIFGHSISSDFHFLQYACQRYGLPAFELEGYDTQKIYKNYSKNDHVQSLEKIVDELNIQTDFQYHKSSDDAHATFLIAKRICKKCEISLEELASRYPDCKVSTADFEQKAKKTRFIDKVEQLKEQYKHIKKKGKIAFGEVFNKIKKDLRLTLVEEIYKRGYEFTTKINECNMFVYGDEGTDRFKFCQKLISKGRKIKLFKVEEFASLLKIEPALFK